MTRRDLVLAAAAPLLLIAVACLQVWRVQTLDQSTWSGAGFGMFATIDDEIYGIVRGYVLDAEAGPESVPLPPELHREALELRVTPTESRARALAVAWRDSLGQGERPFAVEVWRPHYDGEGHRLTMEVQRRVELE